MAKLEMPEEGSLVAITYTPNRPITIVGRVKYSEMDKDEVLILTMGDTRAGRRLVTGTLTKDELVEGFSWDDLTVPESENLMPEPSPGTTDPGISILDTAKDVLEKKE